MLKQLDYSLSISRAHNLIPEYYETPTRYETNRWAQCRRQSFPCFPSIPAWRCILESKSPRWYWWVQHDRDYLRFSPTTGKVNQTESRKKTHWITEHSAKKTPFWSSPKEATLVPSVFVPLDHRSFRQASMRSKERQLVEIVVRQQSGGMELVTSIPVPIFLWSQWNQHNSLLSTRYFSIVLNIFTFLTLLKALSVHLLSKFKNIDFLDIFLLVLPHYWGGLVLWLKHADLLGHPWVFDWWSDLFLLNHNRSENSNATAG